MEISFKTHKDIQIVEIDGALGEPEAAAVRVKLEQKINQGRRKVLFDVGNYPMGNDTARKLLLGIILYGLNRDTLTVCSGVKSSDRPLLILPGTRQVKAFFTRQEALDFLEKTEVAAVQAPGKPQKKTEEEIKEEALLKLLEKYEVYQQNDEDDPFRLGFLAEQYKTTPNRDALNVERKAGDYLFNLQDEIGKLEAENTELAKKVKAMMMFRKVPLSGKELKMKSDTLTKEITELSDLLAKYKKTISDNKHTIDELTRRCDDERAEFDKELIELEKSVKDTEDYFARELIELQNQDTREQAEFEAQIKKL